MMGLIFVVLLIIVSPQVIPKVTDSTNMNYIIID